MNRTDDFITINKITKHYGRIRALDRLDLSIPRNAIFGLLGPNGAGKSTLIKILLGLIKPTSGNIEIEGKDLFENRAEIVKRYGCLMEDPSFYPHLTGRRNLAYLNDVTGQHIEMSEIDGLLAKVGLSSRADTRVKTYSQGMKQRLGLAYALMGNPELIILDEPTNGLDPSGIQEMRNLIQTLQKEGRTICLSSHLLGEVEKVCTWVAIINKGKVVREGSMDDLLAENPELTSLEDYFLHHTKR